MTRTVKSGSAGFTLIELLVVMGMLAVIFAVVLVARPRSSALRLQAEAQTILRELSRARTLAVLTNAETALVVDVQAGRIKIGRTNREIPRDMKITLTVADREQAASEGGFRFYPDGQSSGGDLVLAMDGREARISVNWLSGQPRLVQ